MASGKFVLGVSAQISNLNDIQNQLKNLKITKSISVPVELRNGDKAIRTVNTFKDSVGQTVRQVQVFNTTTGKMSSEIKTVSLNFDKANKSLHPFTSNLDNLFKTGAKVAMFSVLTAGIMAVRNAFASTISIIKDFDDSLTELKKVTTLRGQELTEYTKQLSELGDSVSRTASEMVQSATIFKKSGFSEQDSAMLAQISARFQNVVDSEMSADESANILMSTMKGFGLLPKDVSHIADAINETADTSAVSSTDIANGLANVASVSKTMGNSLEESIGMLTAMVEITQSAGKSSRGLKFCLGSR